MTRSTVQKRGGALLALLMAAGVALVVEPSHRRQRQLREQIDRTSAALQVAARFDACGADLTGDNAMLARTLAAFQSRLSAAQPPEKLMARLWNMAESSALQASTLQLGEERKVGSLAQRDISLKVCGSFGGIDAFLLKLAADPNVWNVTHMNLFPTPGRDGEMTAEMTIGVWLRGGAAPAAAVASLDR